MSNKTEKDSLKAAYKYLLENKVSNKEANDFIITIINFFWQATGKIQKDKAKLILDIFKNLETTSIQEHTKKELIHKFNECKKHATKSKNVIKNDWIHELISNEATKQSRSYMVSPTKLSRIEVSAAILDIWVEDILKVTTGKNDINRSLKNNFLSTGNKTLGSKAAPKKAISPSKPVKEAPKLPALVTVKIAAKMMPWKKIFSQIEDKDGVVSLPDDEEDIVSRIDELLKKDKPIGMAFDECRQDRGNEQLVIQVSNEPDLDENDIWFLGDIHGDLLGMTAAIDYVEQTSRESGKKPMIIYLGDFFDRGEYGHWVLVKLFSQILKKRSQIGVIVGNHDECLKYNEESGEFYATVRPAEFSDWLNEHKEDVWQRLGKVAIKFFERMPRAIFLPDGLFCAHAGVPHVDLHDSINSLEALNTTQCLEDFVWTRAHERAPKKRPNRTTRGCSFGRKDFEAFCEVAANVLGQPVERMLRGHDHYLEGHKHYEKYDDKSILTLNTRCWQPDIAGGPGAPYLCVARWVQGAMPEVHRIKAPKDLMEKVARNYGKDSAHEPTAEAALARAREALEAAAVAAREAMEAAQVRDREEQAATEILDTAIVALKEATERLKKAAEQEEKYAANPDQKTAAEEAGVDARFFTILRETLVRLTKGESKAPEIVTQPVQPEEPLMLDKSFTFNVTADGADTYQWKKDDEDIVGANDSSYTISSVADSDVGSYSVVIGNDHGNVTSELVELNISDTTTDTEDEPEDEPESPWLQKNKPVIFVASLITIGILSLVLMRSCNSEQSNLEGTGQDENNASQGTPKKTEG